MRLLHAIIVVVLLASQAHAQKAGPGEKEIARDGPFVIYSDLDLPAERAKKVIERVKAAYEFVGSEQGWSKDATLAHDLGVRVVSDERMKSIASKAKGVAQGRDTIVITAAFLDEERSARTLAHEVMHIHDRRHLDAKGSKLPHWFTEGRAVAMGRGYEAKLSIDDRKYDDSIARVASTVTVAEAKKILETEAYLAEKKMSSVFRMEALGFFFLEWVRVHLKIDDIDGRLAKIVAKVGGGAKLEDAFQAELQKGLAELEKAFYEHLEKTQGVTGRLAGTALAPGSKPRSD